LAIFMRSVLRFGTSPAMSLEVMVAAWLPYGFRARGLSAAKSF
jgi:hypothetical protein